MYFRYDDIMSLQALCMIIKEPWYVDYNPIMVRTKVSFLHEFSPQKMKVRGRVGQTFLKCIIPDRV